MYVNCMQLSYIIYPPYDSITRLSVLAIALASQKCSVLCRICWHRSKTSIRASSSPLWINLKVYEYYIINETK